MDPQRHRNAGFLRPDEIFTRAGCAELLDPRQCIVQRDNCVVPNGLASVVNTEDAERGVHGIDISNICQKFSSERAVHFRTVSRPPATLP